MDTFLERKIVVGQRQFTSGHGMVGKKEDCNQVTDFMRSRNLKEDMTEDRHLWRLEVDGRLLTV